MTLKLEHVMLVVGAALLIIAGALGFMSPSVSSVHCGSVFGGESRAPFIADLSSTGTEGGAPTTIQSACGSSIESRKTSMLVTGVPGLLLMVGAVGVRESKERGRVKVG